MRRDFGLKYKKAHRDYKSDSSRDLPYDQLVHKDTFVPTYSFKQEPKSQYVDPSHVLERSLKPHSNLENFVFGFSISTRLINEAAWFHEPSLPTAI